MEKQEKTRKTVLGLVVVVVAVVALVAGVLLLRNQPSSGTLVSSTRTSAALASSEQTSAICEGVKQVGKGEFYLPIVDRNGVTGKYLDLADYRCKVVVLEFMGPWCPPCQQVVPALETLHEQYADKGVVFIAVAIPWGSHSNYTKVDITEFLSKYNSSLTYVLDSKGVSTDMYNVTSLPTLFVISKSGPILATYNGAEKVSCTCVAKDIDKALSEPEPA